VPPGGRPAGSIPAPPWNAPADSGQRRRHTGYVQSFSRPASARRALARRPRMPWDSQCRLALPSLACPLRQRAIWGRAGAGSCSQKKEKPAGRSVFFSLPGLQCATWANMCLLGWRRSFWVDRSDFCPCGLLKWPSVVMTCFGGGLIPIYSSFYKFY
jgi:hypothetical protein